MAIKGIIFDFNWTMYDPNAGGPSEGVVELLERLDGKYSMCVFSCTISGISEAERRKQIDSMGVMPYLDFAEVIPTEKGDKDFRRCMEKMGIKPEETLVVGDRIASEISIGNRLGATTVRYRNGKYADMEPETDVQKPDYEIKHFKELDAILERLG